MEALKVLSHDTIAGQDRMAMLNEGNDLIGIDHAVNRICNSVGDENKHAPLVERVHYKASRGHTQSIDVP